MFVFSNLKSGKSSKTIWRILTYENSIKIGSETRIFVLHNTKYFLKN